MKGATMRDTPERPRPVSGTTIVLSIVLLMGVLLMAGAFFRSETHWIYAGLLLTFAASFAILMQILIPHRYAKRERKAE
jgi:membrane protein YdbS with pleckstrin-like domain